MNRKILGVMFGIIVLGSIALAHYQAAGQDDQQTLMDIERKWAQAAKTQDSTFLNSILADNWLSTEADGKVRTKSEVLDREKRSRLDRSEVSDLKVQMIDEKTAVVTGTWSGSGVDADGKKFDTVERFTDTFKKQDGNWKVVASQSTTVPKGSAG